MGTNLFVTVLAAGEYGTGLYGEGAYNGCETTSTTTSCAPGSSSGGLADTGYDVMIPVALGLSIVIASLILLVKRLVRRKRTRA